MVSNRPGRSDSFHDARTEWVDNANNRLVWVVTWDIDIAVYLDYMPRFLNVRGTLLSIIYCLMLTRIHDCD